MQKVLGPKKEQLSKQQRDIFGSRKGDQKERYV